MEMHDISLKMIIHIIAIFGWFWLASWTIVRIGLFKKRVFSLLIFVYLTQGITMISEMLASDYTLSCTLWGYVVSNHLMILGFFCLSNRVIHYKHKLNEKSSTINSF